MITSALHAAVWALLLEGTHPNLATDVIYVAGDRVVSDPLCKPFSMGRCCASDGAIPYMHNQCRVECCSCWQKFQQCHGKVVSLQPPAPYDPIAFVS